MAYAERHIAREALRLFRLERAEAITNTDRRPEIHRRLARESERMTSVLALGKRDSEMASTAGRVFKCVDWFLSGQSRLEEFPARLFWACPEDIRWRFCADALRDERVPRTTKAQMVAWMMYLPAMNVPGRSEALMQILDEDSSRINVLFPALLVRVEYCRRRLPGWRDVAVSAGEDANPAAYSIRYTWEYRFITAEEEAEMNRDDGARFALAMSLSGHRICRTLLLGLVFAHRWGILKFLYETFDECLHVLPANEVISRMCSDGEIHIEGHTTPLQIDGDGYAFMLLLESMNPGCMRKVRDPFGNDLLWQTFFRTQTSHRASNVCPKLEKMLVDYGCDPHEVTSLGVSWADVVRAQYEAGITKEVRDFHWHKDKQYENLRGWFNGLFGARREKKGTVKDGTSQLNTDTFMAQHAKQSLPQRWGGPYVV